MAITLMFVLFLPKTEVPITSSKPQVKLAQTKSIHYVKISS